MGRGVVERKTPLQGGYGVVGEAEKAMGVDETKTMVEEG